MDDAREIIARAISESITYATDRQTVWISTECADAVLRALAEAGYAAVPTAHAGALLTLGISPGVWDAILAMVAARPCDPAAEER